jgi:hypothetical protein
MAGFTLMKHVEAPPEVVFDCASDLPSLPGKIKGITRIEMLTEGPVGVGTRFRETRILFKREASEEMEVSVFERPRRYVFTCDNHGCHYRTEFRFLPNGTGTNVEFTFAASGKTWITKILGVLMAPMIKMCAKLSAKDLDDLKKAVESVHSQ